MDANKKDSRRIRETLQVLSLPLFTLVSSPLMLNFEVASIHDHFSSFLPLVQRLTSLLYDLDLRSRHWRILFFFVFACAICLWLFSKFVLSIVWRKRAPTYTIQRGLKEQKKNIDGRAMRVDVGSTRTTLFKQVRVFLSILVLFLLFFCFWSLMALALIMCVLIESSGSLPNLEEQCT